MTCDSFTTGSNCHHAAAAHIVPGTPHHRMITMYMVPLWWQFSGGCHSEVCIRAAQPYRACIILPLAKPNEKLGGSDWCDVTTVVMVCRLHGGCGLHCMVQCRHWGPPLLARVFGTVTLFCFYQWLQPHYGKASTKFSCESLGHIQLHSAGKMPAEWYNIIMMIVAHHDGSKVVE